jgi:uncharacterized membrane protein YjjP (DUF1212 family)
MTDKPNPEMDYELYMDTAVLAGKIMLESNAESYRVEDTVTRILHKTGLEMADTLAMTTGLVASLDSPNMHAITVVKRITERSTNLNKISKVNAVSRDFIDDKLSLDEAYHALQHIDEIQYNERLQDFAIIGFIQSFIFLMGGTFNDFLLTLPVSTAVAIILRLGRKWRVRPFIQNMLSSFTVALVATILMRVAPFAVQSDLIIISAIMPLLPGTALTNGIRDTFRGDYMSGSAKVLEAFVIALFIAIGIGSGLIVGGEIFG